jgi:predicted RNA-binding protein
MNEKERYIAESNIGKYHSMDDAELSGLAKDGDDVAKDVMLVRSHNNNVNVGDTVLFLKSEIEGKVHLKTVGEAKILCGLRYPSVELEAIGVVLLSRIERVYS